MRRLQQLYTDGYPEEEYRREKEAIVAALQTLDCAPEQEVLVLGDHGGGLLEAWKWATREEKRDILARTGLDRVAVHMVQNPDRPFARSLQAKLGWQGSAKRSM